MNTYKIIRFYHDINKPSRTIKTGLSLKQAQEHCKRKDTHKVIYRGKTKIVTWFDGYGEEG